MVTDKYIRSEIERYRPTASVGKESVTLAKNMAKYSGWHIDKACAFVARAMGSTLIGNVGPDWIKPEISDEDLQDYDESWFRR